MNHQCSEVGNIFGGYDCACGEPWLTTLGGCQVKLLEEAAKASTVTKARRKMSKVAHDLMGRKNSIIKSDKDKGTRSEKERQAIKEQDE